MQLADFTSSTKSNSSGSFVAASPAIRQAVLESFVEEWKLGNVAQATLFALDPDTQQRVMGGFTLMDASRDVSVAFVSFVKGVQRGRLRCASSPAPRAENAGVLPRQVLESQAAAALVLGSTVFTSAATGSDCQLLQPSLFCHQQLQMSNVLSQQASLLPRATAIGMSPYAYQPFLIPPVMQ
jgi:hypothetical protein